MINRLKMRRTEWILILAKQIKWKRTKSSNMAKTIKHSNL